MELSYEGIGAWCATFATDDAVEGQMVRMKTSKKVAACSASDGFCGVARAVRGGVCSVQMSGLAEVSFSGITPAVGMVSLMADGKGGVCSLQNGQMHQVVAVDAAAGRCVIKL